MTFKIIWCTLTRDNKIQWLFSSKKAQSQQSRAHIYYIHAENLPQISWPYNASKI